MKKFGFLAVSLAAVLALGLCGACGDGSGTQLGEEGEKPSEGSGFTMTADTDLRSLTSDVVTEAEWEAAFSEEKFDNFLCVCTQSESYITGMYDEKKADFKLYYGVDEARTLMQHMLMEEIDGKVSAWNEMEGEWVFDGDDYTPTSGEIPYFLRSAILALKGQYSSFTYDEEKGCYTTGSPVLIAAEAGANGGISGVVIKDGVPCGVWMDVLAEDENGQPTTYPYDFIIYGFGDANVDVTVDGEGGSGGGSGSQQGGEQPFEHTHSFSLDWKKNDEYHWHPAICDHTDQISGKEAHTMVDGKCSVCGYFEVNEETNIDEFKSDTVTQEEWETALSSSQLENFLISHNYKTTQDDTYETSYQVDGNHYHIFKKSTSYSGNTQYEEEIDIKRADTGYDEYTILYNNPEYMGKWKKKSPVVKWTSIANTIRSFVNSYGSAVYDRETGSYICTLEMTNYYLKFNGGKLCAIGYETEDIVANRYNIDMGEYYRTVNITFMTIYGYGEAKVVAPSRTDVQ